MLADIHDRLKAQLPSARWAGVEIAEDIDALAARAGQVEHGTAIVMPWGERAEPQALATGGFRQLVLEQYAIGIVIRHYDDMMGGDRALQFADFKRDLETAMAGWEAPDSVDPFELVGGEGSPVETGVSIYVQTWATTRFLTGA